MEDLIRYGCDRSVDPDLSVTSASFASIALLLHTLKQTRPMNVLDILAFSWKERGHLLSSASIMSSNARSFSTHVDAFCTCSGTKCSAYAVTCVRPTKHMPSFAHWMLEDVRPCAL